jgi:hypothetical protein
MHKKRHFLICYMHFCLPSNPEKKSCTERLISLYKIFPVFLHFFIFVLTVFTVFFSLFSLPRKCTVYIVCFCLYLSIYCFFCFFCFLTCPVYRENTLGMYNAFFFFDMSCSQRQIPFKSKITCINKASK